MLASCRQQRRGQQGERREIANEVLLSLGVFKMRLLDDLTQWIAPKPHQRGERAKARKHWEKSFVRWCMCANMDNLLADIIPLGCIVPQVDLDYYCRKEKIQPLRPWTPDTLYNAALEELHKAILTNNKPNQTKLSNTSAKRALHAPAVSATLSHDRGVRERRVSVATISPGGAVIISRRITPPSAYNHDLGTQPPAATGTGTGTGGHLDGREARCKPATRRGGSADAKHEKALPHQDTHAPRPTANSDKNGETLTLEKKKSESTKGDNIDDGPTDGEGQCDCDCPNRRNITDRNGNMETELHKDTSDSEGQSFGKNNDKSDELQKDTKQQVLWDDQEKEGSLRSRLLQVCVNQPAEQQHRGVTVRRIKGMYSFSSRFNITVRQYERLRQLYRGKPGYFHDAAHDLLERYHFFGGLNGHLAMPPRLYPESATELFGTPLNTSHPFCSPFAAEVVLWSSLGSFFDCELKTGFYTANPIFDDAVMERMAARLVQQLKAAQERGDRIDVLITLPIWDPATQIEMGLENSLTDFVALDRLRSCAFFKQSQTMRKAACPYFDYFSEQYVPVSNTHLILLSNYDPSPFSVKLLAEDWSRVRATAAAKPKETREKSFLVAKD